MKEKIKKSAISILIRSIVCLGIFTVLFAIRKFLPNVYEYVARVIGKNMNIQSVGMCLKQMFEQMMPF